jgi:predicted O-linked N-acetylglucosamine transferase (SPINDLY family)
VALKSAVRAESVFKRSLALHRQNRLAEARDLCLQALKLQPRYFNALHLLGIIELQTDHPQRAIEALNKAILINPANAAAHQDQGNGYYLLTRYETAAASYAKAIALDPNYVDAYYNQGNALFELRSYAAAIVSYGQALDRNPRHHEAHNNRGNALLELKRFEAALADYDRAIALAPAYAVAHSNRGSALLELQHYEDAAASCDAAIALEPESADPYYIRGNAGLFLGQWEAAAASYTLAIARRPGRAKAHFNCGHALFEMGRFEAAAACYTRALALEPGCARGYRDLGNALLELQHYEAAVASCDQAIALDPEDVDARHNRGKALFELKNYDAAIASFDGALTLGKMDSQGLHGVRCHAKMQICDWSGFTAESAALATLIERGEAASPPYHLLLLSDSAALQLQCAQQWVRRKCPPDPALGAILKRAPHERIRIGYFSADFRAHPVSILSAELFETHDRAFFEVSAFAFGPESVDPMRTRLERAFERFIDVRGQSDREIALLARSLEIDIAVDLGGFTKGCRPGIFALRAAPLQVGYLGYPGTSGAGYMDYLIADPTIIPERCRPYYSEQILYLPDSCLPGDSQRPIGAEALTRAQAGLPATGCVFCCFNNIAKITPDTFSGWMRILAQVPDSVLWLSQTNRQAESNLRREAASRGVEPHRLLFAPRLPSLPQHLARQRLADLFLDTLPYNAHTTASDALWAGLPVLTLAGESFAGRVAASLLNAVGLPELITASAAQFEALAVALASDPPRLADIRRRLAAHRLSTPLFDTPRYARHLETAYAMIHARHQADLAPQTMRVGPDQVSAPS